MADKYPCPACRKDVAATKNNRYRSHTGGDGESCEMASAEIPEHIIFEGPVLDKSDPSVPVAGVDYQTCPQCDRKVKLNLLGYFEPHDQTLRGGNSCPVGGVRAMHAKKTETVPLPGDPVPKLGATVPKVHAQEEVTAAAANLARDPMASSPESANMLSTSHESSGKSEPPGTESSSSVSVNPSPEPASTSSDVPGVPVESAAAGSVPPVLHLAPLLDDTILQPFSHILQPTPYEKVTAAPMGDLAKELATRVKETFYAYSNRKSSDNRSAQTTLGPSEIGTPCDRRLAMALMGVVPVNPGGDGWAAFVGTWTHAGMAEVYTFADAGTGRYAVEMPVHPGSELVPRGTLDHLDRRDGTLVDWKVMGIYSLKKFRNEGPSATYRTQAHVYGLGAEKAGEKVRNIAIVGLPRAGSSLDEMHIWTEKYDRKIALAALKRVEDISSRTWTLGRSPQSDTVNMSVAREFDVADDCRFCPFFLKGDKEMQKGCPGK